MRLVVCGANRLAFLHVCFEFSSSFLQKYECIQLPLAALSQFLQILAVFFCATPVATILSFPSFLHSLSLLCNISSYFSVEQPTTGIDVPSCFGTFRGRARRAHAQSQLYPGSTKFAFTLHFRKSNLGSTQVKPTFREGLA